MKLIQKIIFFLISVLLFSCSSQNERKLSIDGEVINTDTKSILLVKPNQDMRFDSLIEIPVESGKFHFESKLKYPKAVNLFLGEAKENGGGRYMPLFLENEKINLTIYPEEHFDKNIILSARLSGHFSLGTCSKKCLEDVVFEKNVFSAKKSTNQKCHI